MFGGFCPRGIAVRGIIKRERERKRCLFQSILATTDCKILSNKSSMDDTACDH